MMYALSTLYVDVSGQKGSKSANECVIFQYEKIVFDAGIFMRSNTAVWIKFNIKLSFDIIFLDKLGDA